MPPKHILVATDGSGPAARAVALAATLAKAIGAELRLLTVGSGLGPAEARRLAHAEGDLGAALDADAAALLDDAEAVARKNGATRVQRIAAWGDPAETILDSARDAEMLILGRRGRGRLTGLLLGSVSQKLVSLAPVPVIVVP
ncbi:universal stress protein [Sphingomonas sp. UNC305MFCol5.2]|uniref:universal stress protein n=1 Tax=Sphingomonas sp. UNC305MFCol5.2 TaxID=1449076 RepID=UPI0004A72F4F|nr:universal stress protein [Sphingomonas sp. UNC305MFCol5.2]